MTEIKYVELIVDSDVDNLKQALDKGLPDVEVTWPRSSRDFGVGTAIALAGGLISLINGLLELRDRLSSQEVKVIVRNLEGEEIEISGISEGELRKFLDQP